jgi:hypothetical protein
VLTLAAALSEQATGQALTNVTIADSAANIQAGFDQVSSLVSHGEVNAVQVTDSGIPTLTITGLQANNDTTTLADLSGNYVLVVNAEVGSALGGHITGQNGHATVAHYNGPLSAYQTTIIQGGVSPHAISETKIGSTPQYTDTLTNILQIQYLDQALTLAPTNSIQEDVALLYQGALGRTPDAAGLAYWDGLATALPPSVIASGAYALSDQSSIAAGFTGSPEFTTKYGTLNNTQFVTQLYANVLDRAPDVAGLNFWVGLLNNGNTRAHVLVGFADSAEAITNATNGFMGQSGQHAPWLFLT